MIVFATHVVMHMVTLVHNIAISPVDMGARKKLGIKAGDVVRVHLKIEEKGKTRLQIFEGLVIARKHGNEPGATFTVRKVASGVGVEKVLPLFSPVIDHIEIVRSSKTRRSKLYFVREKSTKQISRKFKQLKDFIAVSSRDLATPEPATIEDVLEEVVAEQVEQQNKGEVPKDVPTEEAVEEKKEE